MAKRGRKPKDKTIDDLEPSIRSEIDEAIRSHADQSAVDIYRRFGLSQRGLLVDTFSRYVRSIRLSSAGQRAATGPKPPPTWEEIERRVMAGMLERLDAGDTKMYELATVIGRRHERARLDIETEAEKRAAEKHDVWKTEYRKKQDEALGEIQGSTRLTPEQVKEIRLKVLGIE